MSPVGGGWIEEGRADERPFWYNTGMENGRQQFIERQRSKFWYTPEALKGEIGDDLLVETTLNYGTLDDFRELREILTPQRMARVFFSATGRKAGNYYPEIRHFFSLVLKPYA